MITVSIINHNQFKLFIFLLFSYLGPCIFKLSKQGNKFKDISNQFMSSWKHENKVMPEIHTIYKIFPEKQIISRYNNYRDTIESLRRLDGKPFPKGDGRVMTKGNEQRRFHGTRM